MNKTTKSSRLQGKDLMNIGIYSAIYCVIVTGVAMLGYIPIMMPMLCVLVPLIAVSSWKNKENREKES